MPVNILREKKKKEQGTLKKKKRGGTRRNARGKRGEKVVSPETGREKTSHLFHLKRKKREGVIMFAVGKGKKGVGGGGGGRASSPPTGEGKEGDASPWKGRAKSLESPSFVQKGKGSPFPVWREENVKRGRAKSPR